VCVQALLLPLFIRFRHANPPFVDAPLQAVLACGGEIRSRRPSLHEIIVGIGALFTLLEPADSRHPWQTFTIGHTTEPHDQDKSDVKP